MIAWNLKKIFLTSEKKRGALPRSLLNTCACSHSSEGCSPDVAGEAPSLEAGPGLTACFSEGGAREPGKRVY